MKTLKLLPDDIWVVSYPKSGTHWVMHIVRLILNCGKDDGKNITEAVVWIESMHEGPPFQLQMNINELTSPRAFKSHFHTK